MAGKKKASGKSKKSASKKTAAKKKALKKKVAKKKASKKPSGGKKPAASKKKSASKTGKKSKNSAAKKASKKKVVKKKTAKKKTVKKKTTAKKKTVKKKTTAKKPVGKKTVKNKAVSRKKTVQKKAAVKKPAHEKPAKKIAKKSAAAVKTTPKPVSMEQLHVICVGGPVDVIWQSEDGRQQKVIEDPRDIEMFDGVTREHAVSGELVPMELSEMITGGAQAEILAQVGVHGGVMYFRYHDELENIWLWTEFCATGELNEAQRDALVAFTSEQWRNGAGKAFHQELLNEYEGVSPSFEPKQFYIREYQAVDGRMPRFYTAPLFYAIKSNNLARIIKAIESGENLNITDLWDDYSLLMAAIVENRTEIAMALIESNVDLNHRSRVNGESALMLAISVNPAIAKQLLMRDVSIESRSTSQGHAGKTPLIWAVYHGDRELVELLLQKGANILERDDEGDSVLHHVPLGCADLVDLLVEAGADPAWENQSGENAYDFTLDSLEHFSGEEEKIQCLELAEKIKSHMAA